MQQAPLAPSLVAPGPTAPKEKRDPPRGRPRTDGRRANRIGPSARFLDLKPRCGLKPSKRQDGPVSWQQSLATLPLGGSWLGCGCHRPPRRALAGPRGSPGSVGCCWGRPGRRGARPGERRGVGCLAPLAARLPAPPPRVPPGYPATIPPRGAPRPGRRPDPPAPVDHQGEQPVAPPQGPPGYPATTPPRGPPRPGRRRAPPAGAPVPNVPPIAKEDGPAIAKVDPTEAPSAQLDGPEAPGVDRLPQLPPLATPSGPPPRLISSAPAPRWRSRRQ